MLNMAVDSGATETVANEEMTPNIEITEGEAQGARRAQGSNPSTLDRWRLGRM